jgi:hypothetical protein
MKDFMFFFRGPSDLKLTPEQSQVQMQKWMDWIHGLTADGHFTTGGPFSQTGKMVKGLKPVVTDGPFTEGKEVMGGYILVKAESFEQAAELSLGFPDYDKGCSLEIRELLPPPRP